MGTPFIIEEADIRLKIGDENGEEVWIGGCAKGLKLNGEFEDRPIEIPGDPFAEVQQVNENHTIEMENVWLMKTDGPDLPIMPLMQRGRVFVLVIDWVDEESGNQNRRVYQGVSWRAQRIGEVAMQNVTFRAKAMAEYPGFETIYYVSGLKVVPVYRYHPTTETFTSLDDTGLAEIRPATGKVEIFIDNVRALLADADKVLIDQLQAWGITTVPISPRLEFVLNSRVASLTQAGELVAGNCYEDDAMFAAASGLTFKDGDGVKRLVFGATGAFMASLEEGTL
jgi:hypothetical protein